MLKRIGIVAWWLGAVAALLVALVIGLQVSDRANCDQNIALAKAIDDKQAALFQRPRSDSVSDIMDSIAADLKAPPTPPDPRDTPAFREKVRICERDVDYSPAIFLILTASLWALSFILGGSFWRPPR